MAEGVTVAGIPIPSSSPLFLAGVAVHVAFAIATVAAGAVAMLSPKRAGRHPRFGAIYFWSLAGVAMTAAVLAVMRWREDRVLFLLALLSFACAVAGRQARRSARPGWAVRHVVGMAGSYVVLLTAFYVDNGKNLPVWRDLPVIAYWLAPSLFGLPILALVLLRHPVVRADAD
jgi:uncharacterized membrane protein